MKLEETENPKLQYVNRIETNTTHINNIQDSDLDLTGELSEILNKYEQNPKFKGKHLSKNGVIIADDTDTVMPNVNKNNKITKTNHKNTKNQINYSINT